MATATWAIFAMIFVSVISALATFFLKLAAPRIHLNIVKLVKNWRLFVGLVFYGFGTIISLVALKGGELSILYPFVALQYVWTAFLSKRFLKEKMSIGKWAGIALIVLGVSLIGMRA